MAETDWEALYAASDGATPVDSDVAGLAATLSPGTAVDLGCGAGQNSLWLARQGWHVTGIDLAPTAIRSATLAAAAEGLAADFAVEDLTSWAPDRTYDLVISTYALPPSGPGRNHALTSAARAVRPGGTLLVAEFDESLAAQTAWQHEDLASLDDVVPLVAGWEISAAEVTTRAHAHGHHAELYPVVLVVARRPTA
jgi:SAM-dependent methyltransferase